MTCGGAGCISQVYRVHCRGRLHWTNSPCIHRHTNTHHKTLYPPSQTHKHTPQNTVPTLPDGVCRELNMEERKHPAKQNYLYTHPHPPTHTHTYTHSYKFLCTYYYKPLLIALFLATRTAYTSMSALGKPSLSTKGPFIPTSPCWRGGEGEGRGRGGEGWGKNGGGEEEIR